MHDPVWAQYPIVSMTDALAWLVNVKQMEGEPLLDYVKRFKQMRDVAKRHLGNKMLNTFVKQSEDYWKLSDEEKQTTTMKEEMFSAWMAYLLICGSDQSKYGLITKGFVSQYSLGNDQYPKTIQMATDVLSNHKIDAKYYENQKQNNECNTNQQEEEVTPAATSFAQKDVMLCLRQARPHQARVPGCNKDSTSQVGRE